MADQTITIDKIDTETLLVPILGTSPLIVHRFSEKAKKQMLDAMQGRKSPKESKDPEAEYEAAFYRLKDDGGYGFPVTAFKQATVGGARFYGKSVTMTSLKQFMFLRGEPGSDGQSLVRIAGTPHMREDVVRLVGAGAAQCGSARPGAAGLCAARRVVARHGRQCAAAHGTARHGESSYGSAGWAWLGAAQHGSARLGVSSHGRRGCAGQCMAGSGSARLSAALLGKAGQGMAGVAEST